MSAFWSKAAVDAFLDPDSMDPLVATLLQAAKLSPTEKLGVLASRMAKKRQQSQGKKKVQGKRFNVVLLNMRTFPKFATTWLTPSSSTAEPPTLYDFLGKTFYCEAFEKEDNLFRFMCEERDACYHLIIFGQPVTSHRADFLGQEIIGACSFYIGDRTPTVLSWIAVSSSVCSKDQWGDRASNESFRFNFGLGTLLMVLLQEFSVLAGGRPDIYCQINPTVPEAPTAFYKFHLWFKDVEKEGETVPESVYGNLEHSEELKVLRSTVNLRLARIRDSSKKGGFVSLLTQSVAACFGTIDNQTISSNLSVLPAWLNEFVQAPEGSNQTEFMMDYDSEPVSATVSEVSSDSMDLALAEISDLFAPMGQQEDTRRIYAERHLECSDSDLLFKFLAEILFGNSTGKAEINQVRRFFSVVTWKLLYATINDAFFFTHKQVKGVKRFFRRQVCSIDTGLLGAYTKVDTSLEVVEERATDENIKSILEKYTRDVIEPTNVDWVMVGSTFELFLFSTAFKFAVLEFHSHPIAAKSKSNASRAWTFFFLPLFENPFLNSEELAFPPLVVGRCRGDLNYFP